jgi:hypothetical protein
MKHWYVPGVVTNEPATLPRARNLERTTEHIHGTSCRDALAFAYSHIKALTKVPETLQNYLLGHTYRLIFMRMDQKSKAKYESLSHNERLDLALTSGIITESIRSLIFQIEFERETKVLIAVFVNLLKELEKGPLEFQPLMQQLLGDEELFQADEEATRLNKGIIRVL